MGCESVCEKVSPEIYFPSAKRDEFLFPIMILVCVCGRGKPNPAGDASEIEEGGGNVRQRGSTKKKQTTNKTACE